MMHNIIVKNQDATKIKSDLKGALSNVKNKIKWSFKICSVTIVGLKLLPFNKGLQNSFVHPIISDYVHANSTRL